MIMEVLLKWFCGETIDQAPYNESEGIPQSNASALLTRDTCVVNMLSAIPHVLFIVIASFLLIYLTCTKFGGFKCIYLRKFHCHTFRWIFLALFTFICACSIAEGGITDFTYRKLSSTQPHLYIPAIFAFLAAIFSLVHYHHSEIWQLPRLSIVSLIYWFLALVAELMKLWHHHHHQVPEMDFSQLILIFRYEVSLISSLVYVTMIVLDLTVLCSQVISSDHVSPEHPSMRYYEDYVNPLSYGLFYWINWLLKLGYDHPLEMKDLGSLPTVHTTKKNYQMLRKVFKSEMEQAVVNNREPSLWLVYLKTFPRELFSTLASKFTADVVIYMSPIGIDLMTSYVENLERGDVQEMTPHYITAKDFFTNVYVIALLFSVAVFIQFFVLQVHYYECAVLGVHLRSGIQALVYEKSIRLSNLAGGPLTVGSITNHMSSDAINLLDYAQVLHLTWSIPVRIVAVLTILYLYVGWSAFLGLLSILVLLPLQAVIVQKSSKHQKEALEYSDDRLKKSSEMFMGIKLLKLYGWEDIFRKMIEAVRIKELKSILWFNIQFGNIVCMCFTIPVTLSVVIFGTYPFLTGEYLTPSVTFTTYVLINMLSDPLFQLPTVLSGLVKAIVATKRLKSFFLAPEIEWAQKDDETVRCIGDDQLMPPQTSIMNEKRNRFTWRRRNWHGFSSSEDQDSECSESTQLFEFEEQNNGHGYGAMKGTHIAESKDIAIQIKNADFTWDKDSTLPILKNINVSIPAGKLVMIVGAVGSGKSSLLSAIISEMTTLRGNINFNKRNRKVAYTAQRAWMINASLRENILFGESFDEKRYQKVIDACALKVDIDILPAGDLTEIGEKGINLSGGQKQRVSVARAMYSNKDIILMDDPLSALDVHVGDHLFREGIKGMLVKNKRTVILVTHQLQHLQQADLIIGMQDGAIVHKGTFDDITSMDPNLFAEWNFSIDSTGESASDNEKQVVQEQIRQKRLLDDNGRDKHSCRNPDTGNLIQTEELERGAVSYQVYFYLLRSMGYPIAIVYAVSRTLQECCNIYRVFWLASWAEAGVTSTNATETADNVFYVAGYGVISLGVIITTILMAHTAVAALYFGARNIHSSLVKNIFKSPMRFFDTTPAGRVLNRLSSDTQVIDTKLLVTYISVGYYVVALPAALIAMSIVTPILLAEVLPLIVVYYFLQKYFIRSSRELQRLDSTTKSPVFAHFSETLGGLSTVRAYGEEERFFNILLDKIDTNNATYLYLKAAYSWIGSQLNFLSFAIVLMASLTTIKTAETSGLSSSLVGLTLSYAMAITYLLYSVLKLTAETEIQMNAVERVSHYTQLVNEDPTGQDPPSNWPHQGEIQIEDIHVRYAADLPSVLTSVNLYVRPGEKVGICGRTGSGKSSLTLSLFRLIDTYQGRIIIDGVDIAKLPLSVLRRRLSIIPQDPVLFTGTIRNNLDPEGTKTDEQLWDALKTAQLQTVVAELGAGLDYDVSEGGENFSVGQRQLFCLARAFLRNSRILIMDEATASIDYETEKVLQEVVSSVFREKTVITIAHRVSTILNSDSIVVLNEGQIAEHDTPQALLARESSLFASLVQANK